MAIGDLDIPRAGRDPWTWGVAVLVAIPFVVSAVAALTRAGVLAGDLALIELSVRDTGSGLTPLVGPFSRYGWNHPGPLMFWTLAPLYRLFGSDAQALYAASATIGAASSAVLIWVARRLGGHRLMVVTAAGLLVMVHGAGTTVVDPWNPYLAMIPFAVFLLSAAALAAGDHALVPLMVGAGSFVLQSHVSYGVAVVVVAGAAAITAVVELRRRVAAREARASIRRSWIVAVAVASVAWVGPVIDQITETPGNLRQVLGFFLGIDVEGNVRVEEGTGGLAAGLGALGRQLHPWGPWSGGTEVGADGSTLAGAGGWWAVPALVALAWAVHRSWRRRDPAPAVLGLTTAVGLAAAFVSTTRTSGQPYWYLLRFWWPLAMLTWIVVGWVASSALSGPRSPLNRAVAAPAVVSLLAAGTIVGSLGLRGEPPPLAGAEAVSAVIDDLAEQLVPGGIYKVDAAGWSLFWEMFGIANQMDARGFEPVLDDRFANHVGKQRIDGGESRPSDFDGRLVVATNNGVDELASADGAVLLASWDPLTPEERAEVRALWAAAREGLLAAGRDDVADVLGNLPLHLLLGALDVTADAAGVPDDIADRLRVLEERGSRVAVYLSNP